MTYPTRTISKVNIQFSRFQPSPTNSSSWKQLKKYFNCTHVTNIDNFSSHHKVLFSTWRNSENRDGWLYVGRLIQENLWRTGCPADHKRFSVSSHFPREQLEMFVPLDSFRIVASGPECAMALVGVCNGTGGYTELTGQWWDTYLGYLPTPCLGPCVPGGLMYLLYHYQKGF